MQTVLGKVLSFNVASFVLLYSKQSEDQPGCKGKHIILFFLLGGAACLCKEGYNYLQPSLGPSCYKVTEIVDIS